ncbi:hypothetical protein R6Z07M_019157 [Ovis aries]
MSKELRRGRNRSPRATEQHCAPALRRLIRKAQPPQISLILLLLDLLTWMVAVVTHGCSAHSCLGPDLIDTSMNRVELKTEINCSSFQNVCIGSVVELNANITTETDATFVKQLL